MAIRTVVVGLGSRGRQWLRELDRAPGFQLVAGVDPSPEALIDVGSSLREGTLLMRSLSEALGAGVDAAIVASPTEEHAGDCRALLEHDVAVLVEKPFTPTLAEAQDLVDLADARGLPLAVAQNYRYMRAWRTVAEVLSTGTIGELRLVNAAYYRPPHELAPSLATAPQTVLWGMAIHHLDALRHVTGQDVHSVSADISSRDGQVVPRGATCSALLEFDDGVRGTYTATYESSGHGYFEGGQEFYARFIGANGTLHVLHRWIVLCSEGRLPRVLRRGRRGQSEEATLLDLFRRAIEDGAEPEPSGRDNLSTMQTVEACIRSSEQRRWVELATLARDA